MLKLNYQIDRSHTTNIITLHCALACVVQKHAGQDCVHILGVGLPDGLPDFTRSHKGCVEIHTKPVKGEFGLLDTVADFTPDGQMRLFTFSAKRLKVNGVLAGGLVPPPVLSIPRHVNDRLAAWTGYEITPEHRLVGKGHERLQKVEEYLTWVNQIKKADMEAAARYRAEARKRFDAQVSSVSTTVGEALEAAVNSVSAEQEQEVAHA